MMNLSFAGCGFLGIYHVGVAVCFRKYAPNKLLEKISGASFGAISACCLLCDLPLGEITSDVLRVVSEARAGSLGPFSPSFNIQNVLLEGLEKFLPPDAHKLVSGRLHISLTRVYDGKNVIVSEFMSKEDLLQALLASCFVPVFSGILPPRFRGIRYMDGGFSDNLPILDENTVTVSPFCGESDICPRDISSQLFYVNLANTSIELSKQNMNRFARILFPPKPEVLRKMCKQGFDDALRFLHRHNLISCNKCLEVQSTYELQAVLDHEFDCEECKTHREDALEAELPDTVMTVFQSAIESTNKRFTNWIPHNSMQLLSIVTLPYRVPLDIVYATFLNLKKVTPSMTNAIWRLAVILLKQLHAFLYSADDTSKTAAQMYYTFALATSKFGNDRPFYEFRKSTGSTEISHTGDSRDHPLFTYYYIKHQNQEQLELFESGGAANNAIVVDDPVQETDWTDDLYLCDTIEEGEESYTIEQESHKERTVFSDPEIT